MTAVIGSAFKEKGVRDISALREAEVSKLVGMTDSIRRGNSNAFENFRNFMRFRREGAQVQDAVERIAELGFNMEDTNVTAIWHTMKLDDKAAITKVDPDAFFRSLVLSINGSRDSEAELAAKSDVAGILKTDTASERIARAYGEWGRIKGIERGIGKSVAEAFRSAGDGTGTVTDALNVFRAGAEAYGKGEGKEAIMQLLGIAETALATGYVSSGKRLITYTVKDNSNVLMIDHGRTGCCAFEPAYSWRGLNYAMDPSIQLVQFASVNDVVRPLDELNPIGVAICVLGVTDGGKRIYFVDTVEGGEEFSKTVLGGKREKEILGVLKTIARSSGATEMGFSPDDPIVYNTTPRTFVRRLERRGLLRPAYMEFKTLCRRDQYLEGPKALAPTHMHGLRCRL
jgi:hypothetical protein